MANRTLAKNEEFGKFEEILIKMVDYEHDFKLIDVIGHYTGKERLNEILEGICEYDTFYNYFYSGVSNSIASCSSVGAELFWKNFKFNTF